MEKNKKTINKPLVITFAILALLTVLSYVFDRYLFNETSVFNNAVMIGGEPNALLTAIYNKIPAVIATIRIVTIAWALSWFIRWLLKKLLAKSNRSTTIVKLINNFIKYLVAIVAFLCILGAWGVNTATIIASAGLVSLVIGLGAQSLISDIIAGMFIVFEDEFRVGDIIIIDGWRGTVDEIGIRTTKIIDWQGNIKILNNSQISTVINQSKELSVTTCVISVDYRESIPRVEIVIKDNLERIKNNIPEIIDGPYYKGVDKLGASSVDLLFVATVKESDYYVAQRAMNKELKLIFDENNISIPFPQVTVNQPEDFSGKTTASLAKKAAEFNAEQRTVSKNLEDTN